MPHTPEHTHWKVAAAQVCDIQDDVPAALRVIRKAMADADHANVDILCFPECFLQGYTLDKAETKTRAFALNSTQFKEIIGQLASYKVAVIIGLIEKENGSYFNTAVVIYKGNLIGKYRKIHLFEKNFQPGEAYPVFTVNGLIFGINICYDARFSEGAIEMAHRGARVIFYPLNNRLSIKKAVEYRDKHIPNLIGRARETSCWIVSSDVVSKDDTHIGFGCSAIVDPRGNVLSQVKERVTGTVAVSL